MCVCVASLTSRTNGTKVYTNNLQFKTLVGYNSLFPPRFFPYPPASLHLFYSFSNNHTALLLRPILVPPLCNAGSFWFSGVTKKMQKGRRDAHEEASVDVMCHYRWFFFFSRCHACHITLWFLLLASSIQGAPGLSGQPNEWEMEQNDTWRLATTGQVRRTHGHDR